MSVNLNQKVKIDSSKLLKSFITFGIPILIWLIPTNEVFTSPIRTALAATFGLLAWAAFELTDLTIPSLLYPIALVFGGAITFDAVYSPWLSTLIPGVLAAFLFAGILERINLLKRLSFWVAIKVGGSFNGIVYAMFAGGFIVNLLTFGNGDPVAAALVFGVTKALNLVKQREGAIIMMAGMLGFSTTKSFWYYPVYVKTMEASIHTVDPSFTIPMFEYLKYNWPVLIFCLIFIALMLKFCVRRDANLLSGKEYFVEQYKKLGKISREEIICCLVALFIMVWILLEPYTGLDGMSAFIIACAFLYLPGVEIGKTEDVKGVSFGVLLFMAACMAIGTVCVKTGITTILGDAILGQLMGYGPFVSLYMIFTSGIVLNFAMTPMAMFGGFSGLFYELAVNLGVDPRAALFTFFFSTDTIFLPYQYLTFLIFFAFGGMTMGQFFKFHAVKTVAMLVFFGIAIIPYWYLVGLL